MQYLKYISILIVSANFLFATVYETGENGTDNWVVYDNKPAGATIETLSKYGKNYIKFSGDGRRNSYMIGAKKGERAWKNSSESTLKWTMDFSEKFKISVYVKTAKGKRTFIYDYKNYNKGLYKKKYIHVGLALEHRTNSISSIERDLKADLKKYEPDNELLEVNAFKVQGSGLITDIELSSEALEVFKPYTIDDVDEKERITKDILRLCEKKKSEYVGDIVCLDESGEEGTYYYQGEKNDDNTEVIYRLDTHENLLQVIEGGAKFSLSVHNIKDTPYIEIYKVSHSAIDGYLYFYYHGKPIFKAYQSRDNANIASTRGVAERHQLQYDVSYLGNDPKYTYVYDISNPETMKFVRKFKRKK